jgi:hypothetical protein
VLRYIILASSLCTAVYQTGNKTKQSTTKMMDDEENGIVKLVCALEKEKQRVESLEGE